VALSVIVAVLAFRGVDVVESWNLALQCRGWELALGGLFFLASVYVRAWRLQVLVSAHQPVRVRSCMSATCVGFMTNNVLPFRLGDLVRVGVLRQLEGVSGGRVLGTVAVERVIDILSLVLVLGGYLALAPRAPRELVLAGWIALAVGGVLTAVLLVGYWRRQWLQRAVAAPVGWVSPRLAERVGGLTGHFFEGLQVFRSPLQIFHLLWLSAALWATAVVCFWFVGQSLGLQVSAGDYVVVVFATVLAGIIPAAPGSVGTFHAGAALGLALVGMRNAEAALAYAAVLHALEWVLINVAGLYYLATDRVSLLTSARADDAAGGAPVEDPQPA
jgi:uncharacterized protein (TIRG00374 family)